MTLRWLDRDSPPDSFPDVSTALDEPSGLLAAGGDLRPQRLIEAYRRGIFPWYESGQPILWWSPDPRAVLLPDDLHVSRSLHRTIRRGHFQTTIDQNFSAVVEGCIAQRPGQVGTWITPEMQQAYLRLHRIGAAHSIEVWHRTELAGGIYGVSLGRVFFGESMFSNRDDASKIAMVSLVRHLKLWNYELVDCQVSSPHLHTMGATLMPRKRFVEMLDSLCADQPDPAAWPGTNPEIRA